MVGSQGHIFGGVGCLTCVCMVKVRRVECCAGQQWWDIYNGLIVRAGRPFCPRVIIGTPSNRPSLPLCLDYSLLITPE